jgi:hypothetical protein
MKNLSKSKTKIFIYHLFIDRNRKATVTFATNEVAHKKGLVIGY